MFAALKRKVLLFGDISGQAHEKNCRLASVITDDGAACPYALNGAPQQGLIKRRAIIHTDRGSQYVAVEYRRLLYIKGFRQSMSGEGNCYDNAQAESFFSRFKAELVEGGIFESVEQARSEIFSYIEGDYNRIRWHSSLGYLSPMEFEKQLEIKNQRSRESFLTCFS